MRATVVLLFLCARAGAEDSLISIGDQKYLAGTPTGGKISTLRYPTLGCPAIVKSGGTGTAWVKLGDGGATFSFQLSIAPTVGGGPSTSLSTTGVQFDSALGIYKVSYQVPADVPDDTYDLTLSVPALSLSDSQPNCFRVVQNESSDFTFIAISDTHFATPTGFWSPGNYNGGSYNALSIIEQMKKEIRALRPTFVILSGDLMFGLDYKFEYDHVWKTWKDTGIPIFMAPGNHDGIAGIKDRWFLGLHSPVRDGLDFWRKYLGPCYYSFRFGGIHFQAVNTIDGTPERRDGFLIIIENYGGDLLPEQMDWIKNDLAGVGETVVPFFHHNPMGPYRENKTFGMWSWVLTRIWNWISTGNFTYISQTWNTKSTADFLLAQYANVPLVFCGHHHKDVLAKHGSTTYREVTTSGAGGSGYWGYAVVRVENSQVTEHLYSPDPKFMSVPTGNLHVKRTDSEGADQTAQVTSGLSKSYEVTIPFDMPAASSYEAANGTIVQVAPLDSQKTRVWVKAVSPVAPGIKDPQTITVSVQAFGVVATAVAGSVESSGGGKSGGACGALGLEALLALGLLFLRRRLPR